MGIDYSGCAFPKASIGKHRGCERCGRPLPQRYKPSLMAKTRFCGTACRNAYISQKNAFPKHPCPVCGKPATRPLKTCSAVCGYRLRKERDRKPRECPICAKSFYPARRPNGWATFCSRACLNVKLSERLRMMPVECATCGVKFRRTAGAIKRVKRVYCSRACSAKGIAGENSYMWRGGHDPNRGPAWQKLAAKIRERDNYICQRCNKTQDENGQKLDVDHIIPWRAFPTAAQANEPRNLVSLCKSCHCYKTARIEQAFLKGDCLAMYAYEKAVRLPPLLMSMPE